MVQASVLGSCFREVRVLHRAHIRPHATCTAGSCISHHRCSLVRWTIKITKLCKVFPKSLTKLFPDWPLKNVRCSVFFCASGLWSSSLNAFKLVDVSLYSNYLTFMLIPSTYTTKTVLYGHLIVFRYRYIKKTMIPVEQLHYYCSLVLCFHCCVYVSNFVGHCIALSHRVLFLSSSYDVLDLDYRSFFF